MKNKKIEITPKFIKKYLEDLTGEDFSVKGRKRNIVELRWVAFKLTRTLTRLSLTQIGELYNKDHATVLHGIKQFDLLVDQIDFKTVKELYNRCFQDFKEMADDFDVLNTLQTVKEVKREYEFIINQMAENYKIKTDNQLQQINNFSLSPIFEKITKLPEKEFKELEVRINAFLQMNAMNQQRKENRNAVNKNKIYEGF